MNAPVTPQTPEKSPAVAFGRVAIRGRVKAVRRNRGARGGFQTLVVLPAPDQFTSPAFVEIMSAERLAEPDSDWQGWCTVGGYRRTYKTELTDAHGDVRSVTVETADIFLTAV